MGQKKIKFIGETDTTKKQSGAAGPKKGKDKTAKSGKSGKAGLTDMGQKALEEMEKVQETEEKLEKETVKTIKLAKSPKKQKTRSKKYQSIKKDINPLKTYTAKTALELIEKNKRSSFDESVEAHFLVKEKLSASVSLPHGTGKKQKIAIADPFPPAGESGQVSKQFKSLLKKIESGVIDFDILIATPQAMPKLAKVAKILGPKGLMPNPKTNTISDKPKELKKKLEAGSTRFKTEAKANLIHFTIGKISFGQKKLEENLKTLIEAIKPNNILKTTLCSTMSPSIKIQP